MSIMFSVSLNSQKTFKCANNVLVLLTITLQVHRNKYHSSLAEDG